MKKKLDFMAGAFWILFYTLPIFAIFGVFSEFPLVMAFSVLGWIAIWNVKNKAFISFSYRIAKKLKEEAQS